MKALLAWWPVLVVLIVALGFAAFDRWGVELCTHHVLWETYPGQHEDTLRRARGVLHKLEARHEGVPLERWPEGDRMTYEHTEMLIRSLGEAP
jgi:hypothetical protein